MTFFSALFFLLLTLLGLRVLLDETGEERKTKEDSIWAKKGGGNGGEWIGWKERL